MLRRNGPVIKPWSQSCHISRELNAGVSVWPGEGIRVLSVLSLTFNNIRSLLAEPTVSMARLPVGCVSVSVCICVTLVHSARLNALTDRVCFWATVCKTVCPILAVCLSVVFACWCIVAKRLDGSRCHLVQRQASAQATLS